MTDSNPIRFLKPEYPPLSDDLVGRAAVNGQLVKVEYPKVARSIDDPPIVGQTSGLISYMLLDEPIKKNGKNVYGYVKVRGVYGNDIDAENAGAKLIREVDSRFQVLVIRPGRWTPITEDQEGIGRLVDVDTEDTKDQPNIRDTANKQKHNEEMRIQRELKEREDRMRAEENDTTPLEEKAQSIEAFIQKRLKLDTLRKARLNYIEYLKRMEYTIAKTSYEWVQIAKNHPEYKDQWEDVYTESRKEYGIGPYEMTKEQEAFYAELMDTVDTSVAFKIDPDLDGKGFPAA